MAKTQAEDHNARTGAPLYRVYEAGLPGRPGYRLRVMVSDSGEARLAEDLVSGRKLFRLGRMLLETRDPAQARRMARGAATLHYV